MASYGFRRGDIIRSVNNERVETVEELMEMVVLQSGNTLLDIQRGNQSQTVLVQ